MAERWPARLTVFALLAAVPGAGLAAASQCNLPAVTPTAPQDRAGSRADRRNIPTTAYTLAVSWSPEYCATGEGMGGAFEKSFQCDTSRNRFGFILHGLWPDGKGTWPQYCRAVGRLKPATIRQNLCMTPSADLLQHEWSKHGSCGWRTPERYFADARALYEKLRFPDMDALRRRQGLTVGAFADAFVAANPKLPRAAVRVALGRQGGLQEVRLCVDLRHRFVACRGRANNEGQIMRIRPIR